MTMHQEPRPSLSWRVCLLALRDPHATIVFALFGSEELGGFGNKYFVAHSPVPLSHIVASLEFEMIGRRDPLLPRDGFVADWL